MNGLDPIDELLRTLRNLAAPPEEQQRYLETLGILPRADELALEFDDTLKGPAADAVQQRFPKAAITLRELDRALDSFSADQFGHLWNVNALSVAEEWRHVRELARRALAELE